MLRGQALKSVRLLLYSGGSSTSLSLYGARRGKKEKSPPLCDINQYVTIKVKEAGTTHLLTFIDRS